MRHSTSSSLIIAVLIYCISIIPSLIHAQAFEGAITMQMASPMLGKQKIDMVYMIKGDKILQTADNPKQGKVTIYSDMKTGTQIIVMEAQKQGMQIDKSAMDEAVKKMHMPVLIPVASGERQKIAGYNCERYTIAIDSSQEMNIWLTKDFPKYLLTAIRNCTEAGMRTTGVKCDALMSLFDNGYAQVKMEMKYDGITQVTNEFARAEQKRIDDAVFIVPSDIKIEKFDPNHHE